MNAAQIASAGKRLTEALDQVLVGKPEATRGAVLSLFCGGHLLIEDVPGVGKTTLAKALARLVQGDFRRIQFTPDLLPSDVTGTSIFNQTTREFEFQAGPIFAHVVLADEINRATPKTQSSLLEAMEERQVTVDGELRRLPRPFMVMATQNNIEMMGTFPLPEAQLDRFFARLAIGYPDRDAEIAMAGAQQRALPIESLEPAITPDEVVAIQAGVREIAVDDKVRGYAVDLVRSTRDHSLVALGSSPRGSLNLIHAAQGSAALDGRDYTTPDDVKSVAVSILSHRILVRGGASPEEVIRGILERVPAPVPVR